MMAPPFTRRKFLGAAAGSVCTPLASVSAQEGKLKLRAAESRSLDYPTAQVLVFLDRYLRQHNDNRLGIQIFADAQLGGELELIQHLRLGIVDMLRVNVLTLAQQVPLLAILGHPHVFSSEAHVRKLIDSADARLFLDLVNEFDIVALGFLDSGTRHLYNRLRSLNTAEDAYGLRLRVDSSSANEQFVRSLGAQPVRLPVNQVLAALNAGLLDGAIDNMTTYVSLEHHRIASYFSMQVLSYAPDILLMSQKAWRSLSEPEQERLLAGTNAARIFMRPIFDRWSKLTAQQSIEQGVTMRGSAGPGIFSSAIESQGEKFINEINAKSPTLLELIRRTQP